MSEENFNIFQQIQSNRLHNRRSYWTMAQSSPCDFQNEFNTQKKMKFYASKTKFQQPQKVDTSSMMKIDTIDDIFSFNPNNRTKIPSKRDLPQRIKEQYQSYKSEVAALERGIDCCPCYKYGGQC